MAFFSIKNNEKLFILKKPYVNSLVSAIFSLQNELKL